VAKGQRGAAIDVPAQVGLLFQLTTPPFCCNDFKDANTTVNPLLLAACCMGRAKNPLRSYGPLRHLGVLIGRG
jgi:hypothetical protein